VEQLSEDHQLGEKLDPLQQTAYLAHRVG